MGFFDGLKDFVGKSVRDTSDWVGDVGRKIENTGRQVVDTGVQVGKGIVDAGNQMVDNAKRQAEAAAGAIVGAGGQVIIGRVVSASSMSLEVEDPAQAEEGYKRSATRSVLAEAALQAVTQLDPSNPQHQKLIDNVEKYYTQSQAAEKQLAQAATPAVKQLNTPTAVANATSAAVASYPSLPDPSESGASVDAKQQQFADRLVAAAQKEYGTDPEFLNFFTSLVRNAVQIQPLGSNLESELSTSSIEVSTASDDSQEATNAAIAAKRALLADAALQAVAEDEEGAVTTFGFFGTLIDVVKKMGPVVIKNAPDALKSITGALGQ